MPVLDWAPFILVGGKSSRYGSDKSQALFEGQTLLDHAIGTIRELDREPRLVGLDSNSMPEMGLAAIPDEVPHQGPVAGIVAAAKASEEGWGLFLPVDMPKISKKHLTLLLAQPDSSPNQGGFAFQAASGFQYRFPCLIHLAILREIKKQPPSLGGLLKVIRAGWMILENHGFSDADFLNINRPSDLG